MTTEQRIPRYWWCRDGMIDTPSGDGALRLKTYPEAEAFVPECYVTTLSEQVVEQQREIERLKGHIETLELTEDTSMRGMRKQIADLTAKLERARADALEEAAQIIDAEEKASESWWSARKTLRIVGRHIRALSTDTTGGEG